MANIDKFRFDIQAVDKVRELSHYNHSIGTNWPVTYIINNAKEAYVGETVHAAIRIEQHLMNADRRKLTEIRIISDNSYNKSVILDLEAFLIKHMGADGKYRLQNGNGGLQDHDYFNRQGYYQEFEKVWKKLKQQGVVEHSLIEIENSELYKYSPYKSLGDEQHQAELAIIKALSENFEKGRKCTIVVRGGAGTGKTILAIYLMKFFADVIISNTQKEHTEDDVEIEEVYASDNLVGMEKIGLVIPQKSLKTSVKDVFRSVRGLEPKMVLSPQEVVKDFISSGRKYDLLFVDEAHRLKCRNKGHLSNYRSFDECNRQLGLDPVMGNELDWLLMCSNNIVLFRDELQTVRPCDIDAEAFRSAINGREEGVLIESALSTQWRCEGGNEYIDYIKNIIACRQTEKKRIVNYDVKLFSDCSQMVAEIKAKEREMGLCRVVAGYAWTWDRKKPNEYTIDIQGQKYRWNRVYDNWIQTPTAIDEIGCIHTVQGYDLNYTGVIIGKDIRYDKERNRIVADKQNYFDQQGKSGVADDQKALTEYLTNIYLTLLTRGIKGTYIYVCDDALKEYFEQFFDVV